MVFQPRTHENGGICCSSELALCEKCNAHFAWGGTSRAASNHAPPDPYEKELAVLRLSDARAAAAKTHQQSPRPTEIHLDANGIPDPYFHDLERMRGANR